jgi:hypothetical protein
MPIPTLNYWACLIIIKFQTSKILPYFSQAYPLTLHTGLTFRSSHLSDVALMAESGMAPEASPRGFTTLHSGSRMQLIGRGFMRM